MQRRIVTLDKPSNAKPCAHCGETFYRDVRNTWAYWERAKYCSSRCAGAAHSKRSAERRPTLREAWNARVIRGEGCWGWRGCTDKDGYPLLAYKRKMLRANRVALELDSRPLEPNQYACHTCDNPSCVNPAHLYPGSPAQNMRDAISRGRTQRGAKQHCAKLSENDVREIRASGAATNELASRYGVSPSNILMVRARKTWKHVK